MDTIPVLQSLRNATSLLITADTELFRPEADSVMLCACHSIKGAVRGFLKSFLADNEADNSSNSIEKLLADCRSVDPGFNDLEITGFLCKTDEGCDGYCLDVNKVSECFIQAKAIEEFVLTSLKIPREEVYNY